MFVVRGEVGAFVAGIALRLEKDVVTAPSRFGHGVLLPGLPAVVGRVARHDGALEGGDGFCDAVDRDGVIGKGSLEQRAIAPNVANLVYDCDVGISHFNGIGHGAEGLFFERAGASVPELRKTPGAVDDGWRAAAAFLPADAGRDGCSIGKGELRIVAGGAGYSAIG